MILTVLTKKPIVFLFDDFIITLYKDINYCIYQGERIQLCHIVKEPKKENIKILLFLVSLEKL